MNKNELTAEFDAAVTGKPTPTLADFVIGQIQYHETADGKLTVLLTDVQRRRECVTN